MNIKLNNKRACVVGSRKISQQDKTRISIIGKLLAALGVQGASGNAEGSDIEWDNHIFVQHFLPWEGHQSTPNHPKRYNGTNDFQYLSLDQCPKHLRDKAGKIAEDHHPAWERLGRGGRSMHTRNVFQALGIHLMPDTFADLTIYTSEESPSKVVKGGTRTAVEISRSYGIPTFNLRNDSEFHALKATLEELLEN